MATENPNLNAGMAENKPVERQSSDPAPGPGNSKKSTRKKHSSALAAAAKWRSAVGHFRAHARQDIQGSSGLSNTGPFVSYE